REGCRSLPTPLLFVDGSILHNEFNAVKFRQICCGISIDRNQVCEKPFFYSTNTIVHVKDFGVYRGRGLQSIHGGHARRPEQLNFTSLVAVRKHTHVTSTADGHA